MKACTFFGHRECPENIKVNLRETLVKLIENERVKIFYVGNQGRYDSIVRSTLRDLKKKYPNIEYSVVLAYMPGEHEVYEPEYYCETMLPEGIENVPKRFAISWRNKWMLKQSDYVVAFVTHDWGGAAQFINLAEKQGKNVINIAQN